MASKCEADFGRAMCTVHNAYWPLSESQCMKVDHASGGAIWLDEVNAEEVQRIRDSFNRPDPTSVCFIEPEWHTPTVDELIGHLVKRCAGKFSYDESERIMNALQPALDDVWWFEMEEQIIYRPE